MGNSIIQLLVLAFIAIFLILRLKNLLGTREGFEREQKTDVTEAEKHKSTSPNLLMSVKPVTTHKQGTIV